MPAITASPCYSLLPEAEDYTSYQVIEKIVVTAESSYLLEAQSQKPKPLSPEVIDLSHLNSGVVSLQVTQELGTANTRASVLFCPAHYFYLGRTEGIKFTN